MIAFWMDWLNFVVGQMRGVGEIDITRTRWSEKPTTIVPIILRNIKNLEPGASKRKFEQGQQEALKKEEELFARLKQLSDGEQRNKTNDRPGPEFERVSRISKIRHRSSLLRVQAGAIERSRTTCTSRHYS